MTSLMERQIGIRTRQGIPGFEGEAPDELRAPAHATGLGILMWADAEQRAGVQVAGVSGKARSRGDRQGFLPRLIGSVARLSPSNLFGNRKRRS
jgi:hypothetical protein